jgi:hypothetical protein
MLDYLVLNTYLPPRLGVLCSVAFAPFLSASPEHAAQTTPLFAQSKAGECPSVNWKRPTENPSC